MDDLPEHIKREGDSQTAAARDVLAERHRQITEEGWTPEHDDRHDRGELAAAAACYASSAVLRAHPGRFGWPTTRPAPEMWPWASGWWKPTGYRRDLVKAGALILAEIERLDRAAPHAGKENVERCFICGEPFKPGDMVLPDINEGLGHRDCFGDDRDGFVDLDTGEPIGPDEPLPTGEPYPTPPAPGGE